MTFRYRLSDATAGRSLGWFVSKRSDWKPGDSIGSTGGMIVVAVVESEDEADFHAHLIVVSPQTLRIEPTEATA